MRPKLDFASRLIYGLLVGVFTWYAALLPIVLMGAWRNKLVPSLGTLTEWPHVTFLIALWAFGASRRTILVAAAVLACSLFVGIAYFGGTPRLNELDRIGLYGYFCELSTSIFPCFLASAIVAVLLVNADGIAPRVFKNWRPVYG